MKQKSPPRNAFYAQSGGVTAVINASACGVIETAASTRTGSARSTPGRNGIIGALTEDLIDTSKESAAAIRALRHTPAGAFGSARYKLKKLETDPRAVRAPDRGLQGARHRLLLLQRRRRFGRHLPQGLAARRAARATRSRPSTCRRPSTTTCRSPTAARASARSPSTSPCPPARPAFDVASMARTSTKVFVLEVMGRHAGWIAAAGGLAAREGRAMRRTSSCSRRSPSTRRRSSPA